MTNDDDTNGVPEEVEEERGELGSTRNWADYDDDGQLGVSDADEEWY